MLRRIVLLGGFVAASCHNEPGELTIINSYTGACAIEAVVTKGDPYAIPEPIAPGATLHEGNLTAGLQAVNFTTRGSACGRQCKWGDVSADFVCTTYVAGGVAAMVSVVDDGPCPMPRATCQLAAGNFDLNVVSTSVVLTRNNTATVEVEITRRGYTGPIMLTASGFGFDAAISPGATIAAGANTGTITVGAAGMAEIGFFTITVAGSPSGPDSMATDTFMLTVRGTGGDLDTAFGTSGKFTAPIGSGDAELREAVIDNNKIVAVGTAGGDWLAVRLNANGTLDTTFGTNGVTIIPMPGTDDVATRVLYDPSGYFITGKAGVDFTVAKLTTAGVLDTTVFGGTGIASVDISGETDIAADLAFGGALLLFGTAGTTNPDFAIGALNYPGGGVATGLGSNGRMRTSFAGEDLVSAVVQHSVHFYVTGTHRAQPADPATLITRRYNTSNDLSLDTTFGTSGLLSTTTNAAYAAGGDIMDYAGNIVYMPDSPYTVEQIDPNAGTQTGGTVTLLPMMGPARGLTAATTGVAWYLAGSGLVAGDRDFLVAKMTPGQGLSTEWGFMGYVTTAFGSGVDQAEDVVLDQTGKIVAVGWSTDGAGRKLIAVAKYKP